MSRPRKPRPGYCLHKASGQAVVYIDRRPVYLGSYNSPKSLAAYDRVLAELPTPESRRCVLGADERICVAALAMKYVAHAKDYYGSTSEELYRVKAAIGPLTRLYDQLPADEFSPKKLLAVRQHIIDAGRQARARKGDDPGERPAWKPLSRKYVNMLINTVRDVFRYGVTEEVVSATTHQALMAVQGIRKGKEPRVTESRKIRAVPEKHIRLVLAESSAEIAAMIQLQLLASMRPDEVTIMRPCDVDTTTEVWVFSILGRHDGGTEGFKTDSIEGVEKKEILLGPRAQAVLEPWLANCPMPTDYLFSPKRAAKRRYPNGNRGLKPTSRYNDDSYCKAVKRACKRAGVPIWTPNQLRHTAATLVRAEFGLEAAQLVLGHTNMDTTQIYAEKNRAMYLNIVRQVG